MRSLVSVNGKITQGQDAKVSVFDRGFLFGDAVYETGRTYDRVCVYLEEHWARLRRSAGRLEIKLPWKDDELTKGLFEVLAQFNQPGVYFRTIVTRGEVGSVSLDLEPSSGPTLVHLVTELNADKITSLQATGLRVATAGIIRNSSNAQDPNIKTSNYLNCLLALFDARRKGGQDAILCDREGHVTEGTTFSVFAVSQSGELWTPSLEVGILDSITRRHVLEVARPLMPVREGFFQLEAFRGAREVFIASSVREIVPITQWDSVDYGPDRPHTRRLQEKLKEHVRLHVLGQPRF